MKTKPRAQGPAPKKWPATSVEMRAVSGLKPYQNNARTHTPEQVDQIVQSIERWGWTNPVIVDEDGTIIAGHGRVLAAEAMDLEEVPTVTAAGWTDDEKRAYVLADNQLALAAGWDEDLLSMELGELVDVGFDIGSIGFGTDDLLGLGFEVSVDGYTRSAPGAGEIEEDEAPEPEDDAVTEKGDVWLLGRHRVMCGDATCEQDVEVLMDGAKAELVFADPPYGMGKENEGIANDNLYREKLDAFQMAWWRTCRPHIEDNASAYIWGNAEGLWRLWFVGGLSDSERMTLRNEIAWDKREDNPTMLVSGVPLESRRMYHPTERCLFFMLGEQGFNNNADNYWDGWEPVRAKLAADCDAMGWDASDIKRITGVGMHGHWFTKSQWTFIPAEHYAKLQAAAGDDAFKREHDAFKREHDELKREFYATRAYFDNTHDNMTDVWSFHRVTGEDRHGHATPKPVALVSRGIKSSTPEGALVLDPFLGSGTTLIAAEHLGRRCYGLEISPAYCDVIVRRFQNLTGEKATLAAAGRTFEEVAAARLGVDA